MLLPLLNGHAHLALCHSTLAREDASLRLCELSLPSFASPRLGLLQKHWATQTFQFIILPFRGFPLSFFFFPGCKVWLQITGNWLYMNHLSVVVWQILFNAEKGLYKSWNLVTSKYSWQWWGWGGGDTGPCSHQTAHDPLSITSQIWHQSLSDNSGKMGKLGESQPTHRLHHLSQEPLGTLSRTRAHTHAKTNHPNRLSFQEQTFKQTFSTRPTTTTHRIPHDLGWSRACLCILHVLGQTDHRSGQKMALCFEHSKCSKWWR